MGNLWHERGQRQCVGTKRYALRCEREGEPGPDGLYACHDHADQREFWDRAIRFDEERAADERE